MVLADYAERARTKAVIDYAFHLIVANPDKATIEHDLPQAIAQGIRSFKVFTTYERLRLADEQILEVMAVARKHGALVMVHAENHGVISWLGERMIGQGIEIGRQLAGFSEPRFPRLAFGQETAKRFERFLRRGALTEDAGGEEQNKSG